MEKEQYRSVIRFLFLDGKTCEETKTEAVGVSYGTAFNILHDECGYQFQNMIELRYELLPHPPYSPYLAPCDFFLFPNLKKWLGGKKFTSNEEVIAETETYFVEFDKLYFSKGLKKWQNRWKKCILLKGEK
ncbi:SETMR methyltransferase, partial [Acromyrmex charruanus]